MMRTRIATLGFALTLGCTLLAGLSVASAAGAQARVEERVNVAVTGDIQAIDVAAKTITVKSTNDDGLVYSVADSASIMRQANKITLGDLKPGWNVVLNGNDNGTTKVVTFIKVLKAP
jgi:hypothetical protein